MMPKCCFNFDCTNNWTVIITSEAEAKSFMQAGVINDLVLLSCVGIRPVFVHGGGPEINTWLEKLGIKAEFKNGLRVTDGKPAPLSNSYLLCHASILLKPIPMRRSHCLHPQNQASGAITCL